MKTTFSTFEIMKALGIPRERLREWMKRDFIKPTISADGQGTRAVFSRQDAYGVELFRQLLERGLARDKARLFVKFFHDKVKEDIARNNYLIIRQGKLKPSQKFGSKTQDTAFFAGDDEVVRLDIGSTDIRGEMYDENWRFIHVINLKILFKETDLELEKA